jgi:photosystem II stability/assembly factor-like uncharacterized protein
MFVAMLVIATASVPEGMAQTPQLQVFKTGDVTITVRDITPADARGNHVGFGYMAVKDSTFYAASTNGLWITTNAGRNWAQRGAESGLSASNGWVMSVALIDSGYLLAGANNGLFKSTDKGQSWRNILWPPPYGSVTSILVAKNKTIFTGGETIFRSVDNGNSWTQVVSDSMASPYVWRMTQTVTGTILAGISSGVPTLGRGVLLSTDNGDKWTLSDSGFKPSLKNIMGITAQNGIFPVAYAVTEYTGAYITRDDGKSWKHIDEIPEIYGSAAATTPVLGIFLGFGTSVREPLYRQLGAGWGIVPGLIGRMVESITPFGLSGVVVTVNNGIFLITFENPTKVEDNSVPNDFRLEQNFPNPFNPSTTIRFSLPVWEYVNLKIYNSLGQMVETVSGGLSAGVHQYIWNASQYPSGIYFYQLKAGTFTETKRMLLVK